jgi:hypothetical protein
MDLLVVFLIVPLAGLCAAIYLAAALARRSG